jgi:succinate dehydrogenase/fumarate reductase flavoprotein subunit
MDFGVAPSITSVLGRLTRDQEYGYAARDGVLAAAFASLGRLDMSWDAASAHMHGSGVAGVKIREAAALVATSRWAYRSALARAESRGMHRRTDHPVADPAFECFFEVSGLKTVQVERRGIPWSTVA